MQTPVNVNNPDSSPCRVFPKWIISGLPVIHSQPAAGDNRSQEGFYPSDGQCAHTGSAGLAAERLRSVGCGEHDSGTRDRDAIFVHDRNCDALLDLNLGVGADHKKHAQKDESVLRYGHGGATLAVVSQAGRVRAPTAVNRWDEKAGLRRDAIRSQVIDALEALEKNPEEGYSWYAGI